MPPAVGSGWLRGAAAGLRLSPQRRPGVWPWAVDARHESGEAVETARVGQAAFWLGSLSGCGVISLKFQPRPDTRSHSLGETRGEGLRRVDFGEAPFADDSRAVYLLGLEPL